MEDGNIKCREEGNGLFIMSCARARFRFQWDTFLTLAQGLDTKRICLLKNL